MAEKVTLFNRPGVQVAAVVLLLFMPLWWAMSWIMAAANASDIVDALGQRMLFLEQMAVLCVMGFAFGALLSLTFLYVRDTKTPKPVYNECLYIQLAGQVVFFFVVALV